MCMYVCVYMYTYAYICICVYIHTYTHSCFDCNKNMGFKQLYRFLHRTVPLKCDLPPKIEGSSLSYTIFKMVMQI